MIASKLYLNLMKSICEYLSVTFFFLFGFYCAIFECDKVDSTCKRVQEID